MFAVVEGAVRCRHSGRSRRWQARIARLVSTWLAFETRQMVRNQKTFCADTATKATPTQASTGPRLVLATPSKRPYANPRYRSTFLGSGKCFRDGTTSLKSTRTRLTTMGSRCCEFTCQTDPTKKPWSETWARVQANSSRRLARKTFTPLRILPKDDGPSTRQASHAWAKIPRTRF